MSNIDTGYTGEGNISIGIIDYASGDEIISLPSGSTNNDNKATMTQEQYEDNQEKLKQNAPIRNAIDTVMTGVKNTLETVQAPFDAVKSVAEDGINFVKDNYKNIATIGTIIAGLAITYYALGIIGESARNIKAIKG
jgi:hypothetical protein